MDYLSEAEKLTFQLFFFTQLYLKVPKEVRLNTTHFFNMKIPNKKEFQQIEINHSLDIDFKHFIKTYKIQKT